MSRILSLRDVRRTYGQPPVAACAGVSLEVDRGEFVAVVGPSGSGKSTLLNLIGTLDRPSSGTVEIDGLDVAGMSDQELSAVRARRIGFVFQQFHLSEGVTAIDNVADGLLYLGVARSERRERAEVALHRVGLGHRLHHRPHQMSGGERQRVAIARAVVGNPPLLLADEPTGNLDSQATRQVLGILRSSVDEFGQSVVMVTHEAEAAAWADTVLFLRDGHVVAEMNQPDQDRVLDALRDLAAQDGARFDGAGGPEPDEPASAGPGTGTREHQ